VSSGWIAAGLWRHTISIIGDRLALLAFSPGARLPAGQTLL